MRGISSIDFIPAEITATGVFPSSVRSDEISIAVKINAQELLNHNKKEINANKRRKVEP